MVTIAGVQFAGNADKEINVRTAILMVREAADRGARIICLPELFSTMYFCVETRREYFDWAEPIPGPTIERMSDVARETGTVLIAPIFERAPDGRFFNTATFIGPDGQLIGKYRKSSIPLMDTAQSTEPRGNEKFYFTPGDLGFPTFATPFARIGILICYDRHFPEGARALGLNGAEMVFIPSATSRGLSEYLWRIEQVSHAVANGYFVGTINRVGIEKEYGDDDFYGQSYFVDPRGQFIGDVGSAHDEELIIRDMDLDKVTEVRQTWQFYRDRRPDAYEDLVRP
jgi:beta-ureidopropionase